jgi:hypothetical protein
MAHATHLAAEYYVANRHLKAQGFKGVLQINEIANGRRTFLKTLGVSGKAEARKLAVAAGATPWNF